MEENLPTAYPYIRKADEALKKAMHSGDSAEFDRQMERYEKAWLRVWQLMAVEHCEARDLPDVDMRYYQHMPDGNNFDMDSKVVGGMVRVYPRKPKAPPKDMRWMTAREMIKVNECPAILDVITTFEAWFDRSVKTFSPPDQASLEASKRRAAKIKAEGTGMKLKSRKGGWDHYE
jgi:hypothetical protein